MRSWKILDIKKFMNHMLRLETFDGFLLSEVTVNTKMSVVIDGHIPEGYYSQQERAEQGLANERCLFYREVRPVCYEVIRGKRQPESFRFVFLLSQEQTAELLEDCRLKIPLSDIANISLNVSFQNGELYITTGVTRRTFTMDKSLDFAWEQWVETFLRGQAITLEKFS